MKCVNPNCDNELQGKWQKQYCSRSCVASVTNKLVNKRKSLAENKELLQRAVSQSSTTLEVSKRLGYSHSSKNMAQIKKFAALYEIELPTHKKSDEEIFCVKSVATRGRLKQRLRELGYSFKCRDCGVGEEWNGKPLSLQLEHINGISDDSRIENITLLCPNCHSQTETFAGRNKKYKKIPG